MMEIKVPSALTQDAERKQIARYFDVEHNNWQHVTLLKLI